MDIKNKNLIVAALPAAALALLAIIQFKEGNMLKGIVFLAITIVYTLVAAYFVNKNAQEINAISNRDLKEAKRKDMIKYIAIGVIALFALSLIGMSYNGPNTNTEDKTNTLPKSDIDPEALSIELGQKNITLYTLSTCSHCQEQKALFVSTKNLNNFKIIECDIVTEANDRCNDLQYVPAWITPDNKIIQGTQTLDRLKVLVDSCNEGLCNGTSLQTLN